MGVAIQEQAQITLAGTPVILVSMYRVRQAFAIPKLSSDTICGSTISW
jgi:hypothetical protein